MKKLYIILIIIAVLIGGYIISLNYFNAKFDKEWLSCETDDDCILVPDYRICSCNDMALNKNFEDDYMSMRFKNNIYQKISLSKFGVVCEVCATIEKIDGEIINKSYSSPNITVLSGFSNIKETSSLL